MPDATEFEQAALQFEEAADTCRSLMQPVGAAMSNAVMRGGDLTRSVWEAIGNAKQDSRAVADVLDDLARECRSRAEQVREAEAQAAAYQASLARHAGAVDDWKALNAAYTVDPTLPLPGPSPTPPPPPPDPPPWAEF